MQPHSSFLLLSAPILKCITLFRRNAKRRHSLSQRRGSRNAAAVKPASRDPISIRRDYGMKFERSERTSDLGIPSDPAGCCISHRSRCIGISQQRNTKACSVFITERSEVHFFFCAVFVVVGRFVEIFFMYVSPAECLVTLN